MKLNLVDFAI